MPKKQPKKKKKPIQRRNEPLRIPLPFEQAVEALLKVKPKKKPRG